VQSRVYTGHIDMNPALIAKILNSNLFKNKLILRDGTLPPRFDVESFIYQLSVKTAETISKSASSTWNEVYKAGEAFWKWYLTGEQMQDDTMYLYNQAVAGTVHMIQMAYEDLTLLSVLSDEGLVHPAKLPKLTLIQDSAVKMPARKTNDEHKSAEETRHDPLHKTEHILGFEPSPGCEVPKLIVDCETLFMKSGNNRKTECESLLNKLECTIVQEFDSHSQRDDDFCPLTALEKIPVDCDVSAHFGVETYRLPAEKECNNGNDFAEYMAKLEDHSEIAHKLELTIAAASLAHIKNVSPLSESAKRKLDAMIDELHHDRDDPA